MCANLNYTIFSQPNLSENFSPPKESRYNKAWVASRITRTQDGPTSFSDWRTTTTDITKPELFRARPFFSFKVIVHSLASSQKKAYALIYPSTAFLHSSPLSQNWFTSLFYMGLIDNDQCQKSGLPTLKARFSDIGKPINPTLTLGRNLHCINSLFRC